jgi:hypothetical protein
MPGFAAPGVLFAGNSAAPDRAFYRTVFTRMPKHRYTRYVEVGVGSFAAALVAANAGVPVASMETSDVTLYTSIVGTLVSGGDLAALRVRLDGDLIDLPDTDPAGQAAHLLYEHWLARMQAKPDVDYWRHIVIDIVDRRDEHLAGLRESLEGLAVRLEGVRYQPKCMWDHIAEAEDDPNAVVIAAPPTYKAGFERFFDTGGRVEWAEPDYTVFDPDYGMQQLADRFEGKPALLMFLQEGLAGQPAHPRPVFAHSLGPGRMAYVISNRPDEIFEWTGGPKVAPRSTGVYQPAPCPVIPPGHPVTETSKIDLLPVKSSECDYYRNLWMHRLAAAPGSYNLLVVVDGYAAGVIGYGAETMTRPYPHAKSRWQSHLIMRFAFGAPHHELRLTRLATMLALQKPTARLVFTGKTDVVLAASAGLVTVEMTRHPEVKGLRGLMTLEARSKHPDGYKLFYRSDWQDADPADVLHQFLAKEKKWRTATRKTRAN